MATATPRRRLPAEQRRSMIVDAALADFAEHGYDAASMRRIAQAAGVTRAVLYDHFPSKRALFDALLETKQHELMSHLRLAVVANDSHRERLRGALDAFFAFAEFQPMSWRLLFPDHSPIDAGAAADHRRHRAASNRLLADLFGPDAERAGFDAASPSGQAIFALQRAAACGIVEWWHVHPKITREELVEAAMKALWSGMSGLEATTR